MSLDQTEMEKHNMRRLSNEESSKLTRECLQQALIHLLSEKEMDEISISELVKRAGVSRTAFYYNYSSKEEVLSVMSDEVLDDLTLLAWNALVQNNPPEIYTRLFENIREDSERFSLLWKSKLLERSYTHVRDYLIKTYPAMKPSTRSLLLAWGGIIKNVVLDWYLGGMAENASDAAAICYDLSGRIVCRLQETDPSFIGSLR